MAEGYVVGDPDKNYKILQVVIVNLSRSPSHDIPSFDPKRGSVST